MKKRALWRIAFDKAAGQRSGQPNPLSERGFLALLDRIRGVARKSVYKSVHKPQAKNRHPLPGGSAY